MSLFPGRGRCLIDKTILFWVIFGAVLIIAEVLLPGLVVVFMGLAALLVALGIYLGLLDGFLQITFAWMVISMILIFTLRSFASRYAPGNKEKGNLDEDLDAFGQVVDVQVVESDNPKRGRVSFRGSTWQVQSVEGPLTAGGRARMIKRENLIWLVEPAED